MLRHKVYEEAKQAIEEHRWLESEKAGHDLGPAAEQAWAKSHWLRFYRSRFVQHLRGQAFYEEFGEDCYGLVSGWQSTGADLLEAILDQIEQGAENLDVLCWAMRRCCERERVLEILKAVDINNRRLPPPVGD